MAFSRTGTEKQVIVTTKKHPVSLVNSIRRSMLKNVKTHQFSEYLTPEHITMLNNAFGFDLKQRKTHTVLKISSSLDFIPSMSHRLSRIPVFNSRVKIENYAFFVCDFGDFKKPLYNQSSTDIVINSWDLVPAYVELDRETNKWVTKDQEEDLDIKSVFKYNTHICTIRPGEHMHAVLKTVYASGMTDCRHSPCMFQYRFNKEVGDVDLSLLKTRKNIVLEYSVDDKGQRHVFDKPHEIELRFLYNGKMDPREAFSAALDELHNAATLFLREYLDPESTIVYKNPDHSLTKTNTQELIVPLNTSDALPEEFNRVVDYTFSNLFSSVLLKVVMDHYKEEDWPVILRNTLVSDKKPHPLREQFTYIIQLPDTTHTHSDLVKETIQSILASIDELR